MFRVTVLGVALLAGAIAAYLALTIEPREEIVEVAQQISTRDVLVADANISPGTTINGENVRWQSFPTEIVNATFIDKTTRPDAMNELQGTVVRSQFIEGEPIRDGKLARPESGFMSAILPIGKRAIAVRVSAQSTAGGFILPNDRVDIIHTAATGNDDPLQASASRTLLSNIRILAIDQTVEEKDGERVVVGKTATLELDPAQVEILTAAESTGTISLSLRSMSDTKETRVVQRKQTGTIQLIRSGKKKIVQTQ